MLGSISSWARRDITTSLALHAVLEEVDCSDRRCTHTAASVIFFAGLAFLLLLFSAHGRVGLTSGFFIAVRPFSEQTSTRDFPSGIIQPVRTTIPECESQFAVYWRPLCFLPYLALKPLMEFLCSKSRRCTAPSSLT